MVARAPISFGARLRVVTDFFGGLLHQLTRVGVFDEIGARRVSGSLETLDLEVILEVVEAVLATFPLDTIPDVIDIGL